MTYLFDHNLDKPVAIKEYLPSDIATRTALVARLACQLDKAEHPNP